MMEQLTTSSGASYVIQVDGEGTFELVGTDPNAQNQRVHQVQEFGTHLAELGVGGAELFFQTSQNQQGQPTSSSLTYSTMSIPMEVDPSATELDLFSKSMTTLQPMQLEGEQQITIPAENFVVQASKPLESAATVGNGQISGTIMSIISSLMMPGATAIQVENNIVIYNPNGQIVQIPIQSEGQGQGQAQVQAWPGSEGQGQGQYVGGQQMTIQVSPAVQLQMQMAQQQQQLQQQQQQMEEAAYYQQQNEYMGMGLPVLAAAASATMSLPVAPAPTATVTATSEEGGGQWSQLQQDETDSGQCEFTIAEDVDNGKSYVITSSGQLNNVNLIPVPDGFSGELVNSKSESDNYNNETSVAVTTVQGQDHDQEHGGAEIAMTEEEADEFSETRTYQVEDFADPEDRQKEEEEDDFEVKIVSCHSLSDELEQVRVKEEKTEEGEDEGQGQQVQEVEEVQVLESTPFLDAASLEEREKMREMDAGFFVKELRNLREKLKKEEEEEKENEKTGGGKTPRIPPLLQSCVDSDDELLIAFKNRTDTKKTDLCQFCYKWCDSGKDLRRHVRRRHVGKEKFHSCSICGARFPLRILRLRHEKLHKYDLKDRWSQYLSHPKRKDHFTRRFRPAPFSPFFQAHISRISEQLENLTYPCFTCGLEFESCDSVDLHYEEQHAVQRCGFCGEFLTSQEKLWRHEEEFHGQYRRRRNVEGGAWALWELGLQAEEEEREDVVRSNIAFFHSYDKGSKSAGIFEEDFIDEEDEAVPEMFDSQEDSHDLMNTSFAESTGSTLEEEEETSLLGVDFEEGMRTPPRDGGQTLPFACTLCCQSYDNEHDLRRHQKCHTSPSKANLACQFCGRSFKTHSHKKEHERTHTGERPYSCPVCQRSFIQSSNLKKHIQTHQPNAVHGFRCDTCGKQFMKEASLVLHQRAHAQDRKFRCAVCDRAYNYASLLKRHMRIHTGEMPYSCESCGMMFHELVSLHYHRKKVHTGERPHKCETCGRAFILSSDLKKHVQIHLKPTTERSSPASQTGRTPKSRSRSQSKGSTEKMEPDSPSSGVGIGTKGQGHFQFQDEQGQSQELSSQENSYPLTETQNQNQKPPIVRVYSRKEQQQQRTEMAPVVSVSSNYVDESQGQGQGQLQDQNQEQAHITVEPTYSGGTTHLISEEDAALLLAFGREVGADPQAHFDSGDQLPKNIEDVLQFSGLGSLNDLMNNIVVVPPEAEAEIEIIVGDQKNRAGPS